MTGAELLDPMAQVIFRMALESGRSGELLSHLFEGGGVTVDPESRTLILIPPSVIQDLAGE